MKRGTKYKNVNNAKHDLTILHTNIRGLRSKKESLNAHIKNIQPDIVTINEHGITGKIKWILITMLAFLKIEKVVN